MNTIKNNLSSKLDIKNSEFITYLYYVSDIDMINIYLNELKVKYKDATHICYAYILDGIEKSSDDGEPGGTAGLPILTVLKNKDLCNVLAVVIRYFGGIKLGAGGLVRAYTKSITNCLENSNIVSLIDGYNINLIIDYSVIKEVDYILRNEVIISKEFNDKIIYNLNVDEYLLNQLKSKNIDIKIINKIKIAK